MQVWHLQGWRHLRQMVSHRHRLRCPAAGRPLLGMRLQAALQPCAWQQQGKATETGWVNVHLTCLHGCHVSMSAMAIRCDGHVKDFSCTSILTTTHSSAMAWQHLGGASTSLSASSDLCGRVASAGGCCCSGSCG